MAGEYSYLKRRKNQSSKLKHDGWPLSVNMNMGTPTLTLLVGIWFCFWSGTKYTNPNYIELIIGAFKIFGSWFSLFAVTFQDPAFRVSADLQITESTFKNSRAWRYHSRRLRVQRKRKKWGNFRTNASVGDFTSVDSVLCVFSSC